MPRTVTIRNWNHPIQQMRGALQQVKSELNSRSNALLMDDVYANHLDAAAQPSEANPSPKRKDMIRALMAMAEERYRTTWRAKYGWDIEDARDNAKLREHLRHAPQEAAGPDVGVQ